MATLETLDSEITAIHAQIASLRARRSNLSSILLSTPHLPTRLAQRPVKHERHRLHAARSVKEQTTRNTSNIYRACAGVTAYKVADPDPQAVDSGNILGVRIEVFIAGKFVETYNVLFNRPSARHKTMLKIHRHTIPPCIPVKQLANRYLPMSPREASEPEEQNLIRFGRALRQELVAWHLRSAAVEKLRVEAGLPDQAARGRVEEREPAYGKVLNAFVSDDEDEDDEDEFGIEAERSKTPVKIVEIEIDQGVRQITVTWSSGQTAVLEVMKDGEVVKGLVRADDGRRVSDVERKLPGRIEGLIESLFS